MSQAPTVDFSSIQLRAESTPNPATMKFCFSTTVIDRTLEFNSATEAENSPLASKIFGFPWATSVLLAPNFIAITKQDWIDWDYLTNPLTHLIQEHFQLNLPVLEELKMVDVGYADDSNSILETDTELVKKLKQVLNREIRPMLAYDGGDVQYAALSAEGILSLRFKGACSGCPSKSATLKGGIEVRIKELFPEIISVTEFTGK